MNIHSATTVSDRIVEQLLQRIGTGNLSTGDWLPSERQLMREFEVSRLACREALAKLQGMGIIKAKHGKGAYLADISNPCVNPAILRLLSAHGDVSNTDVVEARLIVEPSAAGLAAGRADSRQKDMILRRAQETSKNLRDLTVPERAERFAEDDVGFHQAIAEAGGNTVLPMMLKGIHELLLRVRLEVLILRQGIIRRAMADHQKIAAAIVAGDAQAAEKAMEQHIRLRGKELLKDMQS